jgi:hypothetical protein
MRMGRLHNGELHTLNCSSNIIRMIKSSSIVWRGHIGCMGECRNAYKILGREPEGKR